jgi:hypothetical protein
MNGRAEVERHKQRLDATFAREAKLSADAELLSDFARYLCVLVSGFLEQSVIELTLEHVRTHAGVSIQRYAEARLRKFTSANARHLTELLGSFDPAWRVDLQQYLTDEPKDAVDSVIALRHQIAHGRSTGLTMTRIKTYYAQVKNVVDHVADLCVPV